jgi:1-deoxy-D-xylulose-5-phosphate synthase
VTHKTGPTVIRFPKGATGADIEAVRRTADGVDVLYESAAKDVLLVGVGSMASTALKVSKLLEAHGIGSTVIDPRWVVPVSKSVLQLAAQHRLVVTIEDGVKVGGIGTRVRQDMRTAQVDTALTELGLPDEFLEHASRGEILERVGLTPQAIARDIVAQVLGAKIPHAKPLDEPVLDRSRADSGNQLQ